MAATDLRGLWRAARALAGASAGLLTGLFTGLFTGLLAGLLPAGSARAVELPDDRAETMVHVYDGGGTRAVGPALLLRKRLGNQVALSGSYYVDMVSNASIDVVTQASKYSERRTETGIGADWLARDTLIHVGATRSNEPDYQAQTTSLDLTQDVFGGQTTVSFGAARGQDVVRKKGTADFLDHAQHWQYRAGVTQILSPRWLLSANGEAVADSGYLGSPYRAAYVFGAAVPERNPRTRSSRALKLRLLGDVSGDDVAAARASVHADYRLFKDNWGITAHTAELGYSRHLGDALLLDGHVRYYRQGHALFYSDNAQAETLYVSRNRQLATFHDITLGGELSWTARQVPGQYELKLHAALDLMAFRFADFSDIRTGQPYRYNAKVVQLYATATF